jgi:hypothetical protein
MKLYQKKVQPAYVSCQEKERCHGAGGGGGWQEVRVDPWRELANG